MPGATDFPSDETVFSNPTEEKNINWNDYPTYFKRGSCCVKRSDDLNQFSYGWIVDNEIPIFKNDGRKYINDRIFYLENE